MAATSKNYDIDHIHQGPGDLWIIGGGVTDSAAPQLTLTSGTPDSVTHPTSIHLGSTESSIVTVSSPKFEDIMVDQAETAVDQYLVGVEMSLEATLKQLDPTMMQQALPYTTYATAGGYKQLTFGGLAALAANACIALIAPKRAVAGKYIVAILFKSRCISGLSVDIGRAKSAGFKAQFKAYQDLTRVAGRQTGVVYETI